MADESTRKTGPMQPKVAPDRLWRELLGEQLRAARQERGETLHAVALRASLSPQYLSEIERGRKEPSSEIIAALGAALERTLLDLTVGVATRLGAARSVPASRGEFNLAA